MKKCFLFIALTIFLTSIQAQYKKASFLNKTGRIYDLGTTVRLQGGERGTGIGFYFSYGKQSNTKRLHHWFDWETVLGSKYSYSTSDVNSSNKVQVSGKTGLDLTFRYNLAYFLADNSEEDKKILPFINAGIGYVVVSKAGDDYSLSPDTGYPDKTPLGSGGSIAYGGGGGIIYQISSNLGIRFSAAYYAVSTSNEGQYFFSTLSNHPAISVGLRFKMDTDND
jgi:hypothetical protein